MKLRPSFFRFSLACVILAMAMLNHGLSQETIITVPFNQPAELSAEAGMDIVLAPDSLTQVGNGLQITGGSPGYTITWVDPENTSFYDSVITTGLHGMYHLYVTDQANCSDSDSLLVYPVTRVENFREPEMRLFPNPTKGKLYYSVGSISGKVKVTLISSSGYKLKELTDADPSGFLDLQIYPPGIYLLRISNARQSFVRQILLN